MRLIPGDPARQVAGPQATKEDVELVKGSSWALTSPSPAVYQLRDRTCKGDLGTSLRTKRPVLTEVQGRYMKIRCSSPFLKPDLERDCRRPYRRNGQEGTEASGRTIQE